MPTVLPAMTEEVILQRLLLGLAPHSLAKVVLSAAPSAWDHALPLGSVVIDVGPLFKVPRAFLSEEKRKIAARRNLLAAGWGADRLVTNFRPNLKTHARFDIAIVDE